MDKSIQEESSYVRGNFFIALPKDLTHKPFKLELRKNLYWVGEEQTIVPFNQTNEDLIKLSIMEL